MAWIEALIKVDLAERSQINDMKRVAFDVQNGDYAAEYVAKFGHEASEKTKKATGNTWGVSHELSKGYAKVGKRLGGRTPFTLVADYIEEDKEAGELFQEFARCFKGKVQLFWSPKLRNILGIKKPSKEDKQIAAEAMPEREFVTLLEYDAWKLVLSRNARWQVLEAAASGGAQAVAELLLDLAGRRASHQGVYYERGTMDSKWHKLDA